MGQIGENAERDLQTLALTEETVFLHKKMRKTSSQDHFCMSRKFRRSPRDPPDVASDHLLLVAALTLKLKKH